MKNPFNKILGKHSSKTLAAKPGAAVPHAKYLGFDFPTTKPNEAKAALSKRNAAASLPKKAAASVKPTATPAATAPATRPKAATTAPAPTETPRPKATTREPMPFTSAMGGFRRGQRADTAEHWPEMVNGVATGRYIEVTRPKAEAPELDSSSTARRIIAAGERAFGK